MRNTFRIHFLLAIFFTTQALGISVPFQNIVLQPGNTINASYTFSNPPFPLIFCYENSLQNLGIITWTYHHTRPQSNLPIYFKTNAAYEGEFADPSGMISIYNNQHYPLIISCQYGL